MAKAAGIGMTECRLLEEDGRRHFMTRRFDRLPGGEKLHMQSLCALAHFDWLCLR
jgi:serine/threonine-protein kinase HipA